MLIIFAQWIIDELIKKQNICYWRDCSLFDLHTWKFSISWMKKNMRIQPKNIPEKIVAIEKLDEME